jgi:hypothetical protein
MQIKNEVRESGARGRRRGKKKRSEEVRNRRSEE